MKSLVLAVAFLATALPLTALGQSPAAEESDRALKPPKLKKFVEAADPPGREAVEAKVLLSIEINAEGKAEEVEVIQSAGADFDAAAVEAAKRFEFEPARMDGTPIPVKIQYAYRFQIKEVMVSLGPQINFEGVVLYRDKKDAVERVRIRVVDLDVESVTDENGAFAFTDLPPGQHVIELSAKQLVTVKTEENITKGKKKTVKYLVEEKEADVDEESVGRAPRIKKEVVETRVRTEEARRVPGTQGDTLKVVQNLPGVARSAFGSGAGASGGGGAADCEGIFAALRRLVVPPTAEEWHGNSIFPALATSPPLAFHADSTICRTAVTRAVIASTDPAAFRSSAAMIWASAKPSGS